MFMFMFLIHKNGHGHGHDRDMDIQRFGYRMLVKILIDIRHDVRLGPLKSCKGGFDVRLSLISDGPISAVSEIVHQGYRTKCPLT
jgi:hypothetical protein